eukprot:COSAG05_NODE_9257_length_635_cov_2.735075_1_plen_115_part_00
MPSWRLLYQPLSTTAGECSFDDGSGEWDEDWRHQFRAQSEGEQYEDEEKQQEEKEGQRQEEEADDEDKDPDEFLEALLERRRGSAVELPMVEIGVMAGCCADCAMSWCERWLAP